MTRSVSQFSAIEREKGAIARRTFKRVLGSRPRSTARALKWFDYEMETWRYNQTNKGRGWRYYCKSLSAYEEFAAHTELMARARDACLKAVDDLL